MKPMRRTLIALAASLALNGAGEAATRTWVGPSNGKWTTAANWQGSARPVAGDDVYMLQASGGAVFDGNYSSPLHSLLIGGTNTTGTFSFAQASGTLWATTEVIGYQNQGSASAPTYLQTGGSNTVSFLKLADGASTRGFYQLSGGTLAAQDVTIASASNSQGSFTLSGTGAMTAGTVFVGRAGVGSFAQSGGSLEVSTALNLGGAGGTGSYSMTGGTLSAALLQVGLGSHGVFDQSGGTSTITQLNLGSPTGEGGSFTVRGTATVNVGNIVLNGTHSVSDLNIDGGTLNFTGTAAQIGYFNLGSAVGSNGSFALGAGQTLKTGLATVGAAGQGRLTQSGGDWHSYSGLNVGANGSGAVVQTGGTATVGGTLNIGADSGGTGTGSYQLSGSGILNANVVNLNAGAGGPALSVAGGQMNVATSMFVGPGTRLDISAGALTFAAGSSYFSADTGSQVTQSGGTFSFTGAGGNLWLYSGSAPNQGARYTLSGGSLLNASLESVGAYGSAPATFIQTGGNNTLAPGGTLLIGDSGGAGNYQLSGGSLNADNLVLGTETGITGSLELGASGQLTSGFVWVGYGGNGSITQTGGTHAAQDLRIGASAGGSGSYAATGAASRLSVANTLVVGDSGSGQFSVTGGAVVSGSHGIVGNRAGSSGSVSIADAGSKWLMTGNFYLGNEPGSCPPGGCTLSISNGGQISSANAQIDFGGVATLTGTGTGWSNTGDLSVGAVGVGSLSVLAGARVGTATLTIGPQGQVLLNGGSLSGDVTNNGSFIYQSGSVSGAFTNGVTGSLAMSGSLLVGGTVSNLGDINLATGMALGGSSLSNDGSIVLGGGTLTGGRVTVGSLGSLSGTGVVTATGLVNHGTLTPGAGTLTVVNAWSNDGLVQMSGPLSSIRGGALSNTGAVQGLGALNLAVSNAGMVEALGGGTLALNGTVANLAGGTLAASAGNQLLLRAGLARNAGTIALTGGSFSNNRLAMTNAGQIDGWGTLRTGGLTQSGLMQLSGGSTSVFGSVLATAGSKTVVSGASSATFFDAVDIQSGAELRVSAGASASFFGTVALRNGAILSGSGAKFYEGGLSVGNSPGLAVDAGDVHLGADNVYLAEIGGTTPGIGFDVLHVAGQLSFGGTLKLVSWNGYVPTVGQSFDLFDWGSSAGTFSRIDTSGLALVAGTLLDTSRLMVDGTLSVQAVPEPGSWALMLGGLGVLLRVASRRGGARRPFD